MTVPYNEAGKQAFEVFSSIARKMHDRAVATVEAYVSDRMPEGRIIGAEYIHSYYDDSGEFVCGKYRATVSTGNRTVKVTYDYGTKEVEAA